MNAFHDIAPVRQALASRGEQLKQLFLRLIGGASLGLTVSTFSAIATPRPALSAEEIQVLYGPVQVSVSIDSLETFANEGTIEPDLEAYARRFTEQELAEMRTRLQSSVQIEQVALANFLYTPQGEAILRRLGDVIRTKSNSGFFALRASLILAAGEDGGANPLALLKAFPTQSIVIDVDRGLEIVRELDQLTNVTSNALSLIETQFRKDATPLFGVDGNSREVPNHLGSYLWDQDTLTLEDPTRDRTFDLDLYLPTTEAPAPLIIISHGLGSDRTSYRYLAEHLASHGFAVAAPEHPGSNANYIQALFEGAADQISEPDEFVNRAQDISFILDELERMAEDDAPGSVVALGDRLDLNHVGVIGQSFGGYTALSLGGAAINFQRLETDCPQGNARRDTLNLSLLLQCRAASLPPIFKSDDSPTLTLRDERVTAIMAINPIGSTVFGPEGFSTVDVPVLMVASSSDVIAPTLFEQIFPFSWLKVRDKYLVLIRKATHFSTIGESLQPEASVPLPTPIIGPDPQLAQSYVKTLSVAFLKTHLSEDSSYQIYLSPGYVDGLSRDPLPLSIVRFLNEDQLTQMVKDTSFIVSALE